MFFTVFIAIKMKTFLLFLALTCATTTATPNGNGEPLSAFLTSLKQALTQTLTQALENLLAIVQRFENEQSTQIDHPSE